MASIGLKVQLQKTAGGREQGHHGAVSNEVGLRKWKGASAEGKPFLLASVGGWSSIGVPVTSYITGLKCDFCTFPIGRTFLCFLRQHASFSYWRSVLSRPRKELPHCLWGFFPGKININSYELELNPLGHFYLPSIGLTGTHYLPRLCTASPAPNLFFSFPFYFLFLLIITS